MSDRQTQAPLQVIQDVNLMRFFHYVAMFGWGLVRTAPEYPFIWDLWTIGRVVLLTASVFMAMLFMVPLEKVSRGETVSTRRALISCGVSLLCAVLTGFEHGILMGVFLGILTLYHAPPVALHRVRLLARLVLAVNSLLLIAAGNLVRKQPPGDFDPWVVAVIMVGAAAFGLVELVLAEKRPQSHRAKALLAGHLASVGVMLVYQVLHLHS
jgi:thiamine transporter ThiT